MTRMSHVVALTKQQTPLTRVDIRRECSVSDTDTNELHTLALRIALTIGRDPRTQALELVERVHAFHGHHDQSTHGNWADKPKHKPKPKKKPKKKPKAKVKPEPRKPKPAEHAPSYETDAKNRAQVDRARNLSETLDEYDRRVSQAKAGNAEDAKAKRKDYEVNALADAKKRAAARAKAAKERAEKAAKAKAKREREKKAREKKKKAAEKAKKAHHST